MSSSTTPSAPRELDLSGCASEPIHTPGAIQPYGLLLVLNPDGLLVTERAIPPHLDGLDDPLDAPVDLAFGGALSSCREAISKTAPDQSVYLGLVNLGAHGTFHGLAHRRSETILVELEMSVRGEPSSLEELYPSIREFMLALEKADSVTELCDLGAAQVSELTGFDRTLVYEFDAAWNGAVVAESRNEALPSYMDLRFPESDIPAQARELYRKNRIRLIADSTYQRVPLVRSPSINEQAPTDLSPAMLRSVSPVHLQYMRNMGTGASMSISLVHDGKLWGLISCHNEAPKQVPYHVRTTCEFVGQILALQIAQRDRAAKVEARVSRRASQMHLLGRMTGDGDFVDALRRDESHLLDLTRATGAAIVRRDECVLMGACPNEAKVREIARWISAKQDGGDLYDTDQLAAVWPGAADVQGIASGILAISISQLHDSYLIWFRPEVVRTVRWGGDPRKEPHLGALSPRLSFEIWKETVRGRSIAWDDIDRDAAMELRVAIVDIVLRKAEELAEVNEQLVRTNKELEAFSYSVSHDLRAPFRHIVGYSELLTSSARDRLNDNEQRFIDTIVESAKSAGTLVDDLLSFSQLGRSSLGKSDVSMGALVDDVRKSLEMEYRGREVKWNVQSLPSVHVDPAMMRQVWQNLIANAIKFSRHADVSEITIGHRRENGEDIFWVRDNGCGFDMRYVDKLFGVFQRLHHVEDFEGTGIGLANVHRIVTRHGGRVWAEGEPNIGATFYFSLPR